eukprot:GFUD01032430.1.p1 GENE.GFUD01032430.1~~GFUD01032430.1.p1  ORF type:complete len:240 (+),score=62.59 GFUD01032430.1:58-720(+)
MDSEFVVVSIPEEPDTSVDPVNAVGTPEVVAKCTSSGVWERSENRRWLVVMNSNHRIPSRTRARSEGSLDPCLSIQSFINNFDFEEPPSNTFNVISDGNTMIRIDNPRDTVDDAVGEVENREQEHEEDPMEGSSGSQTRRVKTRARRRSSHLASPEQVHPNAATVNVKARRRRRRRRQKKVVVLSGNFSGKKKRWKKRKVATSVLKAVQGETALALMPSG